MKMVSDPRGQALFFLCLSLLCGGNVQKCKLFLLVLYNNALKLYGKDCYIW